MLEKVPTNEEMIALIGQPLFEIWIKLSDMCFICERKCFWLYDYLW